MEQIRDTRGVLKKNYQKYFMRRRVSSIRSYKFTLKSFVMMRWLWRDDFDEMPTLIVIACKKYSRLPSGLWKVPLKTGGRLIQVDQKYSSAGDLDVPKMSFKKRIKQDKQTKAVAFQRISGLPCTYGYFRPNRWLIFWTETGSAKQRNSRMLWQCLPKT